MFLTRLSRLIFLLPRWFSQASENSKTKIISIRNSIKQPIVAKINHILFTIISIRPEAG
jgi:hypothetical protein